MIASLRPLGEDEYPAHLEHVIATYARDMIEDGLYRSLGLQETAVTMTKDLE